MSDDPTSLDPGSLPWDRLVAESSERTCEAYAKTLRGWLEGGEMDEATSAAWQSVFPVLSLVVVTDPERRTPFWPDRVYGELKRAALVPLVATLTSISDPELRARIIDVAWQKRACTHEVAAQGVTAYVQSSAAVFSSLEWLAPFARLKRAVNLGVSLGRNSPARTEAIAAVEQTIDRVGAADERFFVERLMRLLLAAKAGDPARMAALAGDIARIARSDYEANGVGLGLQGDRERDYLEVQQAWLHRAGDQAAARHVGIEIAESFVRHADGVLAARWPMYFFVAARSVEDAIEQLRKVGNQDQRINALRARLEQLQRAAIQAMLVAPLPEPNEAALEAARAYVAGKPIGLAVLSLAFGSRPEAIEDLEQQVRESGDAHLLQTLMPASYVGPRGATQAAHGGLEGADVDAFATEVMRAAANLQQLKAEYFVAPALEQIMDDHNLETSFFLALAWRSAFVPQGRKRSYGLGLAAGAQGDFDVAAALLFPQFEHAVREVFHKNSVVTTTLPNSGIQNELDLNAMLKHDAMAKLFGARQAYDLSVLLAEKAGSNLRNDLAHGGIDDGARFTAKVYFWWICFRFAIDPYAELRRDQQQPAAADGSST